MINTQVLKGNLIRQDYTTAFTLNQGDKGVPFKVELLENGTPYTLLSGDIVVIEWLKPNGNPFLQEGGIKYGTNYIEFTTPEAVAQYSGTGTFNIIITNNNVRKGTIRREYKVVPTSMKPGSISEDVIIDAITELRNLNTELAETVQNNQEIINSNSAATKTDIANVNSSLEDIPKFYAKKTEVNSLATSKAEKIDLNNTNTQVAKNATDIATQSARIDSFTSLAEGSTTGDAELIDGRIEFDGFTNDALGTAIREQVSMLNQEIIHQFDNVIGERSKNAYSPTTATLIQRYDVGCSLIRNGVKVVGDSAGHQIVNIVVPVEQNKTYNFNYNSSVDISVKGIKLATSIPTEWSNTGFVDLSEIHTTSNTYIIVYFQLATNVSGTIYFSLREKIEDTICEELASFKDSLVLRKSRNLYNPYQLEPGLIDSNGNVGAVDDYSVTGFIPISEGQTIYFSRYTVPVSVYQIALYNINGIFISRQSAYITSYTATSGVAYVRIGMLTSNFPNGFQIEYDTITNYQAYFEPYYVPKTKHITVSKDGTQDYTTVSDAVFNATDGDTILVYPGIYDNEQVEAWGKTVHIIGFDKKKTIIKNSVDEYATPPLEIAAGSVKNLTIIAETGGNTSGSHAYAVHIEDDVMYNNSLVFDNCCFKATLGATVGMGMRGLCDVEFNNCEFINEGYEAGVGTSGYALYFHDTIDTSMTGTEKVTIKNCLLVGKHTSGVVVRIDSNGLDDVSVNMQWQHNILDNEYYTTTYLSLHNKSGVSNTDWKGLKGYSNSRTSFGNNASELNYTS